MTVDQRLQHRCTRLRASDWTLREIFSLRTSRMAGFEWFRPAALSRRSPAAGRTRADSMIAAAYRHRATGGRISAVVGPIGVVVDVAGNLFIADAGYSVIRTVSAGSGIISTVAGRSGHAGSVGGNGPAPATSADLYGPEGIALDAYGNLFIADSSNNRVREVSLVAAPAKTPSFNSGERVGVQFKAFAESCVASENCDFVSLTNHRLWCKLE